MTLRTQQWYPTGLIKKKSVQSHPWDAIDKRETLVFGVGSIRDKPCRQSWVQSASIFLIGLASFFEVILISDDSDRWQPAD